MLEKLKQSNTEMAKFHDLVGGEKVTYEEARDAICNPEQFARKIIHPEILEISPGINLSKKTVELGEGNFTNVYDIFFKSNDSSLTPEIITKKVPLYPHRIFINEEKTPSKFGKPLACINGAFFFLQDENLEKTPNEIIYNLNIREGKVLGLPAIKRGAIFTTKEGEIEAKELEAKGVIMIGNEEINWIGGEPTAHNKLDQSQFLEEGKAILFNSACCSIEYADKNDKKSLRKLRKDLNFTPVSKDVTDIVVTAKESGELYVSQINLGGGTDFFEGNFILQIKSKKTSGMEVGDVVTPTSIDGLKLSEITSGMTAGPRVEHFLKNTDHEINHDLSLGSFPPFDSSARYARSVMYKDKQGYVHMVIFDAVPRSKFMKGVTPKEAAENIPNDLEWSVFLDGGQSSRLTFEQNFEDDKATIAKGKSIKVSSCGNQQYIRLHERYKTSQSVEGIDDQFLWSRRGRPLSSMIMIRKKD